MRLTRHKTPSVFARYDTVSEGTAPTQSAAKQ